MAWVTSSSLSTGDLITASEWNQAVVSNTNALRAGGIAIASQAAGDLVFGASSTALSRLAIGTANKILTSSGSSPQWSSDVDVPGTLDVTGATTLATVATGALSVTGAVTASGTMTATQYLTGVSAALAPDATTNLYASSGASGPDAGMIVVRDGYSRFGLFWYGSYDTLTKLAGNAVYSASKDNATTINIYYESGNIVYQNKTAVDPLAIYYTRILY
jgi:predicted secreted Zn-dependent protease